MNNDMETKDLLGRKAKDVISGFKGVITGHAVYLTGCSQVLIAPPSKDGVVYGAEWFDIQRVELTTGKPITLNNENVPGADRQAPRR